MWFEWLEFTTNCLSLKNFSARELLEMAANDVPCCEPMFWLYLVISIALVSFAGLMSGLTLGLMSLSQVDLEILAKAGQPQDRKNAGRLRGSYRPVMFLVLHMVRTHLCFSSLSQKRSFPSLKTSICSCAPFWLAIPWPWRYHMFFAIYLVMDNTNYWL